MKGRVSFRGNPTWILLRVDAMPPAIDHVFRLKFLLFLVLGAHFDCAMDESRLEWCSGFESHGGYCPIKFTSPWYCECGIRLTGFV